MTPTPREAVEQAAFDLVKRCHHVMSHADGEDGETPCACLSCLTTFAQAEATRGFNEGVEAAATLVNGWHITKGGYGNLADAISTLRKTG